MAQRVDRSVPTNTYSAAAFPESSWNRTTKKHDSVEGVVEDEHQYKKTVDGANNRAALKVAIGGLVHPP
jgi:hypothetical protein